MGLEGFSNNASGGMSPGDPLYAKMVNKLATSADKAQVGPSDGVIFTANNGGLGMYIPQQNFEPAAPKLEQFEIVVEPYEIGGEDVGLSIIRVVKGEVVWTPVLPQDELPVPLPTDKCVTQTKIINWFALPTFPIIDDEKSLFIGDGGIRVPNVEGIDVGIYVFKSTMLPIDHDPIIVAVPNTDYSLTCPVEFPGLPPFPLAVWQAIKVGSAKYEVPEGSEEDTPPQWVVTQNFIGSMVFPGGGSSEPTPAVPPLPAQLKSVDEGGYVSPFQCFITQVNNQRYLQIANGSCTFTQSNMPVINTGAFSHTKQAYFDKVQICPEGTRTSYEEMWPIFNPEPEPGFSEGSIMENGGGYKLSDTANPLTLYAFKWDVDTNVEGFENIPISNPATKNLPTLALISQSNTADYNKIAKDKGPSIYEQTMNIKRMSGYTVDDTSLDGDWGHCHTTWMNPRKFGYNMKVIATVNPSPNTFSSFVYIEQVGIPSVCNCIQTINFYGEAASGVAVISAIIPILPTPGNPNPPLPLPVPSVIPFPVVSTFLPTEAILSDELAMFRCLNSIPGLTGNVQVSRGAGNQYFVTFINALQGLNIPLLQVDTSAVVAFSNKFEIIQYHTGDINLETQAQLGMTQLMNKDGQTEADDPYNKNKDADPSWNDIINRAEVLACKEFSGDVTWEGVGILGLETESNPDFTIQGGCSGDGECIPFKVKRNGTVGDDVVYEICPGTVNNIVPQNIYDTFILVEGDSVWLRCDTRSSDNEYPYQIFVESGTTMPSDTDDFGYVKVAKVVNESIEQYITGSLWTDRIKLGTLTATYYFARI